MDENALSKMIIGAAIEVHKQLGPGLLESAYEHALAYEFTLRDIPFARQKPAPVVYKGVRLDCEFIDDLSSPSCLPLCPLRLIS